VRRQIEEGQFELWFPAWMKDIALDKMTDIDRFLAGAAAYTADRVRAMGLVDPITARRAPG